MRSFRLTALLAGLALLLAGCGGGKAKASQAPPSCDIKPAAGVALVKTTEGCFSFGLDPKDSPHAVASFEKLARKGFFNGTIFHRIVPNFVIQGGDPTGKGTGGPGYSTHDKVSPKTTYLHGTVAMAKTPTDPAGTAGSQFFIVTEANAGLPPIYAVIGHVAAGLPVVDKIGTFGNAQEEPTKRIVVQSITIGS